MKTRCVSHEFFLPNFVTNTVKKNQRKIEILCFGKASLRGNVPANTGEKRRNETWGRNITEGRIPGVFEKKKMAASVNGPGDWGQSDHRCQRVEVGLGALLGLQLRL